MNFNVCLANNTRDSKTLKRIETAQKTSVLLGYFFSKGFKTFESLLAIVHNYYPEIPEKRLWNLWHFRQIDEIICENLEDVFEKLKNE
jgi:hypothetical protein